MGKQGRRRRPRGIRSGFPRYVSFYFRRMGNLYDMTSCFLHKGFNDKRTETPNTAGRQIPAKASSSTAGLTVFDPGSVVKELNPESGVKPFKSNSAGRTKPKHGKFILTLVWEIRLTSCFVYRPIGFVDFVFRRAVVAAARESSGGLVKLGIRRRGFGPGEDQFR